MLVQLDLSYPTHVHELRTDAPDELLLPEQTSPVVDQTLACCEASGITSLFEMDSTSHLSCVTERERDNVDGAFALHSNAKNISEKIFVWLKCQRNDLNGVAFVL